MIKFYISINPIFKGFVHDVNLEFEDVGNHSGGELMIRFLGEHDSIGFVDHLSSISFDVVFIHYVMEFVELVVIV